MREAAKVARVQGRVGAVSGTQRRAMRLVLLWSWSLGYNRGN